jgi:hypothetical protein
MKKFKKMVPKQKYVDRYVSKMKEKPGPNENPKLLIWNDIKFQKVGLDEYVIFQGELIPVYEFFDIEYEDKE